MKNQDVINIIQSFLDGMGGEWDWDDFISIPIKNNSFLETIRKECAVIPEKFPPQKTGEYCNEEGIKVLKGYIRILKEAKRIKEPGTK